MNTWQDTAKRMRAHPEWKWLEGMAGVIPVTYRGDHTLMHSCLADTMKRLDGTANEDIPRDAYPDLTDWATVGVILGMVVEAERPFPNHEVMVEGDLMKFMEAVFWAIDRTVSRMNGQALGELWLELTGGDGQ